MTDRYHALTVVLDHDIRNDDAERLMDSIKMLRGVLSVAGDVADMNTYTAIERARHDLGRKLVEIVYPGTTPTGRT